MPRGVLFFRQFRLRWHVCGHHSFGFRIVWGPIFWRERDPPKRRGRFGKRYPDLRLIWQRAVDVYNGAAHFFIGCQVFHSQLLARQNRFVQLDQSSVRVDNQRFGALRKRGIVGACPRNRDGNR